jgi:hypothetical protein
MSESSRIGLSFVAPALVPHESGKSGGAFRFERSQFPQVKHRMPRLFSSSSSS